MVSPDGIQKTDTCEPLYNSRLINNCVEYAKKFHPEVDLAPILHHAGIISYELEDPGHWFNQQQVDRFNEMLAEKTGDSSISRKIGRYAVSSQVSGTLRQHALGFVTTASAYRMLGRLAQDLSRAHEFKTSQIARNKVEITVTQRPGVNEKPYQCDNRLGLFESLSKLFTNKFAEVEHASCLHKGSQIGHYIITWEKTPALIWKMVRNYSLMLGILVSLALLFVLPILPWVVITLVFVVLVLLFSFVSSHLEKKELIKTVENQGDAAKDLLDEMNIRYNNALLVQEIGQATSQILEIDKIVSSVVSVMESRLDFDRGMIMLANKKKTRLIYAGGYGYNKEQEIFLRGTEFHLDNLHSKGMFVSAFNNQKAILLNDISKNGKDFSARTLETAKRMGVKSLICVPIVYENKALGILTVDNVKSKRVLTQSDMNVLKGVASQTAVNIVEAISFQKLQESEKKYRDLVENANSIILRRDISGN
ncbi:MAG: GAF domain-containing protein, partial [Methanosarcinaceae archaeon]|nr:GAF domain-containing protein [Methanosarcinaceae archaeon]